MNESQLYSLRDHRRDLGRMGEEFVLAFERRRLAGHPLLHMVRIVGQGDIGLGYDIASFENLESTAIDRYIEVKTYAGDPHFFFSGGEHAAAHKHTHHYYIYLIDSLHYQAPDYQPLIIRDPLNTLSDENTWKQKQQTTEYTLINGSLQRTIPDDFDLSIVMVGCFNNDTHKNWILSRHCYNVRAQSPYRYINGAVNINEETTHVRYMVLYNVQNPREHAAYEVRDCRVAANSELRAMGYVNPHCPSYLLYGLIRKVDIPAIDIMQLLRASNDKVVRRSGTPVYILGRHLRRFMPQLQQGAIDAPHRGYSNSGKPWTQTQDYKLTDWINEGRDIAFIAQKLYRTVEEVRDRWERIK